MGTYKVLIMKARKLAARSAARSRKLHINFSEAGLMELVGTANSYGYSEVGPFVRRLCDAARLGDRHSGAISFFDGKDAIGPAPDRLVAA